MFLLSRSGSSPDNMWLIDEEMLCLFPLFRCSLSDLVEERCEVFYPRNVTDMFAFDGDCSVLAGAR